MNIQMTAKEFKDFVERALTQRFGSDKAFIDGTDITEERGLVKKNLTFILRDSNGSDIEHSVSLESVTIYAKDRS